MNIVLSVVTLECLEPGHFYSDRKLEEMPPMGDVSKFPVKILIYYLMTLHKASHMYIETVIIF